MYTLINKKQKQFEKTISDLRMAVKEILGPNIVVIWENNNRYNNPWTYLKSARGRRIFIKAEGPGMCSTVGALQIINNN